MFSGWSLAALRLVQGDTVAVGDAYLEVDAIAGDANDAASQVYRADPRD